ncbi:MAG: hypothetical protein IT435_17040 [Phycisphaerales bacterium]|nr:hypothetical protein [Phycisphaerales bacterium]
MTTPDPIPLALCTSCRYDLSAQAAHQMPEITCPECGRSMKLSVAINLANDHPHWSFEHSRHPSPRRWLATSLRAYNPRRFWRDMAGAPTIRPLRWLQFAAIWLICFHIGLAAIQFAIGTVDSKLWDSLYSTRSTTTYGAIPMRFDSIRQVLINPYTDGIMVQFSDNSFRFTEVISFLILGSAFFVIPPLLMIVMQRVHHLPRAARYWQLRCFVPLLAIILPWIATLPVPLAGAWMIERHTQSSSTGLAPPMIPFLACLLAGPVLLGFWWFWIVRSTTTRWRAIVAAVLAIIGAITGFAGVLALLSTLDINF